MAKQGLSCQWQKKEVSWFQLCQETVHGHGQATLPQIFSSFIYSLLPESPLASCQAVLSCRRTLIPCSSVELGLSSLPCTLWSSCRAALVPLNFLSRTEISCPWYSLFFPVLMPQFQLVQFFHVQFYGVGMKSEPAAHGYTAAGPYFFCLLCSS